MPKHAARNQALGGCQQPLIDRRNRRAAARRPMPVDQHIQDGAPADGTAADLLEYVGHIRSTPTMAAYDGPSAAVDENDPAAAFAKIAVGVAVWQDFDSHESDS